MVKRVGLVEKIVEGLDGGIDAFHLGTCVKLAVEHGERPLDLPALQQKIAARTGKPVVVGTHPYIQPPARQTCGGAACAVSCQGPLAPEGRA
jgi:hypothetical protein